jgi:hypothetical protein
MRPVPRLPILPGSSFLRGAHHPHCDRHGNHLIWVRGRPLCLGCTCMGLGVAIGSIATALGLVPRLELLGWVTLHVGLVGPTALQPWLQVKPYKIAARFLLGIGSATWFWGCLGPGRAHISRLLEFALSAAILAAFARLLWLMRDRKSKSPCVSCPLGYYPTCSWNLPRLMSEAADPDVARALEQGIGSGAVFFAAARPVRRSEDS